MTDFNLSDSSQMIEGYTQNSKIKEFIKQLKEMIMKYPKTTYLDSTGIFEGLIYNIDNLAGDRFI